jgi:transposase-like protein
LNKMISRFLKNVKEIHMTIAELLDAAKRKQGSLGTVAAQLGVSQSTLSNWRAIRSKPNATEVAMLAEMAELPIFETLAEVEKELDAGGHRSVWDRALGNLRAAGIAAGVVIGTTGVVASVAPQKVQAAEHELVRPAGIEPATPAFGGQYSIH